jgi:hypothetical protein
MYMVDTKYRHETPGRRGVSGGVALRLVLCAMSLLILGGAIVALMSTFKERKAEDYTRAERMCDIGIQETFERLNPDGASGFGGLKGLGAGTGGKTGQSEEFKGEPDENGANYSVVLKRENRGDTSFFIKIESTGSSGSVSVTKVEERTFRLAVTEENDSVWVNE